MRRSKPFLILLTTSCLCLLLAHPGAQAEEGMWTFDNPPTKLLKERYGFEPDQRWLDHVRLSSLRFMNGGSGSFVSSHGLVITNHHVGAGQLQKLSTPERNLMATGFYASEIKDELVCPDLEVNVLVSMEEVSKQVSEAVKKGLSAEAAVRARDAAKAAIEKKCMQKTKLRCDVISLYHGGQYWLYRSKKYTDVRLVMAPERQAAFFGGDHDNFTFPRHDLDITFFRVYEDGKPLQNEHHLKWNPTGAKTDELLFITGHPGKTDRLYTMRQLELNRDLIYPMYLEYIARTLEALTDYAKAGAEQQRQALIYQMGFANGQKALGGEYEGLKRASLMKEKAAQEKSLRDRVDADPKLKKSYAGAWSSIERVYKKHAAQVERLAYHSVLRSGLAKKAIQIVQYVEETKKPDAKRLDGYHDSELEELKFALFSPAPIFPKLEAAMLAVIFQLSVDHLPKDDAWVKAIQSRGGPAAAADKLCTGTKLTDPEFRKNLIEGGKKAVAKSEDPFIAFARELAPLLAAKERWTKKNIESVTTPAKEQIARARFAIYGTGAYPDATFSLRLAFGTVRGYPMNGTLAQATTTLYGLYDRALGHGDQGAWKLPKRYWDRKQQLKLETPVNFVIEADIIGGNSGSPAINRKAEFVGIVFDGNMESLTNRFLFDRKHSRTVTVHAAYILAALNELYDAADLADEITQAH